MSKNKNRPEASTPRTATQDQTAKVSKSVSSNYTSGAQSNQVGHEASASPQARKREQIRLALDTLTGPDQVVELRIPKVDGRPRTDAGYYDGDLQPLIDDAARYDASGRAPGIYVTLNPVSPDLLARSANRIQEWSREATSDDHILRRLWFPIDIDPTRPTGISASDEEHAAAHATAANVAAWLADELQWDAAPIVADSGNGAHLLYPVDLPNDIEVTEIMTGALRALAGIFDNDECTVDTGNYNASRIWKLYGTKARKGDDVEARPHRYAHILSAGNRDSLISPSQLAALAAMAPETPTQARSSNTGGNLPAFDLAGFVDRHSAELNPSAEKSTPPWAIKWRIDCPQNADHAGDAMLAQRENGPIVAQCSHNSCSWKWQDLRARLDPAPAADPQYTNGTGPAAQPTKPPSTGLSSKSDMIASDLNKWGYEFSENELDGIIKCNDQPLDEAIRALIRMNARDNGYGSYKTSRAPLSALEDMITVLARRRRYHPVRDWLDSLEWDGADHVANLADHFVDTAPPIIREDGKAQSQFHAFLYRWMLQAVDRVYRPSESEPFMLVLDGGQGLGKSYFSQWLCPIKHDGIHQEKPISPNNAEHHRFMATVWIWEVGELGSTMKHADREALKHFITQTHLTFRVPYARDPITRPALSSFIGTINNEVGFLDDPTGSRRFAVVPLAGVKRSYSQDVDPTQMWAQVMHAYKAGEPATLDSAERAARLIGNEQYKKPSDATEAILKYYDVDPEQSDWWTYTIDIVQSLNGRDLKTNSTKVGIALRDLLGKPAEQRQKDGRRGKGFVGIKSRDSYKDPRFK